MKILLFILLIIVIILIFITFGIIADLKTLRKEMLNKFEDQKKDINKRYEYGKTYMYDTYNMMKDKADRNIHY